MGASCCCFDSWHFLRSKCTTAIHVFLRSLETSYLGAFLLIGSALNHQIYPRGQEPTVFTCFQGVYALRIRQVELLLLLLPDHLLIYVCFMLKNNLNRKWN